ncbi:MAG: MOSC domain-containing protein [Pikeienuella sp.]|uniref:MOSC domain-containing protein n=1 Tax=Pikeienuella sp. TaxID=2831957 RepID=UPI00391B6DDD
MEIIGRVAALWRHPVSSMGGEPLETARLGPGGIEGDRIWGVADAEGVAAPEKIRRWLGLPSMRARLGLAGPEVETAPGKWAPAGSAEAAAAVSGLIGAPARLLPHCSPDRTEEGRIAPRYVRNDLHLLSTASLRALAALTPGAAAEDVRRFRPNLVVETREGIEGFFEQGLAGRRVVIGAAEIEIEAPCMRCAFTGLGQSLRDAELPFEPKIVHAISAKGGGAFGALCGVRRGGEIRIGDPVTLLPA